MKFQLDKFRLLLKSSGVYLFMMILIRHLFGNSPSYSDIYFGLPENNIFGFAASIVLLYTRYVFLNNCILYYYRIKDQIILRQRNFHLMMIKKVVIGFIAVLLISLSFLLITNMNFKVIILFRELTMNLVVYLTLLSALQDKTDTTLVFFSIITTLFLREILI